MTKLCGLIVAVVLSGCGLFGGNHSCDMRPKSPQCTDWRDLVGPATVQEGLCRTLTATAGDAKWVPNQPCPAEGSVGGCQNASAVGKQTNWFYAPRTEAEVRAECMQDGETYVTP